jgi:ATP-dependent helicase/nuclease subunit A
VNRRPQTTDEKDRDRAAADLERSFIVEAAAGTGKTTLLVTRVLNLIKAAKARPEEMVAITFTERAAAELKAKLQDGISACAANASGLEAARLTEAVWGLDRMQVTTIHAFCTSLLKERPVEAGIDPNFTVADQLTESLLFENCWDEWLAREMARKSPVLARALKIGLTPDNIHQLAHHISANRDVVDLLPEPHAPDDEIASFVDELNAVASRLERDMGLCSDPNDKLLPVIEGITGQAQELLAIDSTDGRVTYIFHNLAIPRCGALGRAANWSPKGTIKEIRQAIAGLIERQTEVKVHIAHDIIARLARELLAFLASYEKAKADAGCLDFHDLLLYARNLLKNHGHVREYFARRFRYIFVDEFQDTDPLQAEIVFLLAGQSPGGSNDWQATPVTPGKLFLVGDPKQSIYRFRRADIEMYTSAKALLGNKLALSIHRNFRCAESLVGLVNRVFRDLIKSPEDGTYQPDYVALDFGRTDPMPARHGGVLLYPPASVAEDLGSADRRRLWEFRTIAAFIRNAIGNETWEVWDREQERLRPMRLGDVAILMRNQTGLDHLENALRLYEIDYRVIRGKRFFLCEEVEHLTSVLKSIDNPEDKVALVAALRSPFFGVSDEDLFLYYAHGGPLTYLADARGTPLEEALGLLRRLNAVRNKVSVPELLNMLFEETKAPVLFLLRPNGEQRVANLFKISDTARELSERGLPTFRAFVRWLAECKEGEAEEGEAATVETGDDFVRLLTVHKAKGLEFPVVILADLAAGRYGREPFIVDRLNGRIGTILKGKDMGIRTENYTLLKDYEELRREAEERRMLYVAMTRARDLLVMPVHFGKAKGSFMSYLEPHIPPPGVEKAEESADLYVYDTSKLELEPPAQPPFRVRLDPGTGRPPRAAGAPRRLEQWEETRARRASACGVGRRLKRATGEKHIPLEAVKGDGAAFGRLVHTILERMEWTRIEFLTEVASRAAREEGAGAKAERDAVAMVKRTLASDLMRRVISSDRHYKEVPFAFEEEGAVVEGIIDVLFEEDGRIGVVDFKTDRVPESRLGQRIETYRDQVETYRRAVTAACGKPPEEVILFFLHPLKAVVVR